MSDSVSFRLLGVAGFEHALDDLIAAADIASREIVSKGGEIIAAHAKTHAAGRPGPNVVSGALRASIVVDHVISIGPGSWVSVTGPTIIYGRRIELGFHGADSLGRVYDQGPFPYFEPGFTESIADLDVLAREVWGASLERA